ncbi:DUF6444 domain-containing protein [Brasilonema bromeliae]|uniref:DUF6444 domain-containing protein n=1 Tax=Brasilonema bromeliae SPC951 TaxID=385972 RepID=A0ABX1P6X2_9CYAN|nr:DUF6444 domain-containing protein [Brasilonema bromeliae]NMG19567.1 hypothetical protein [Brasilonema bromeliae SPC951]
MEENSPAYRQHIPQQDWERTPPSVQKLVEDMWQCIEKLEQQVGMLLEVQQQLLEKINCTSKNSSSPPSTDPPNTPKTQRKQKSGRKRGGQKGHEGHGRSLYPAERCARIVDHINTLYRSEYKKYKKLRI